MITPKNDELLRKRLDELCEGFEKWVGIRVQEGRSDSPARHFHIKTIKRLRETGLDSIFSDPLFFDYLYATLITWGMDRAKKENRLFGFRDFVDGICSHREEIAKLGWKTLATLNLDMDSAVRGIAGDIWNIVQNMRLSGRKPKLVLGSKALHHLLPDLVPPIDNTYTLDFFLIKGRDPERQFGFVFKKYVYIHQRICEDEHGLIDRLTSANPLNSSVTKTIDNAIQGYQISKGNPTGLESERIPERRPWEFIKEAILEDPEGSAQSMRIHGFTRDKAYRYMGKAGLESDEIEEILGKVYDSEPDGEK